MRQILRQIDLLGRYGLPALGVAREGFCRAKMYLLAGFIAGMEGELLAALPAERLREVYQGKREMWRLGLLLNRKKG